MAAEAAKWVGNTVLSATTATIDSFDMTSGANDIIVIRHENGDLQSSPFNVRFGKAKVIRRSDKYVYVSVNGERATGVVLKLGPSGEAFWVASGTREVPLEARCSPITSPMLSPRDDEDEDKPAKDTDPEAVSPMSQAVEALEALDIGRGIGTDAVEKPEVKKQQIDPNADLTEEQILADTDSECGMMSDDEADALLADQSQIMKQLNERLGMLTTAESSAPVEVKTDPETKLRLARSAEEDSQLEENMAKMNQAPRPEHVHLGLWKRVKDKDTGEVRYWNLRTNECTTEEPDEWQDESEFANGEPNLSSDEDDEDGNYDDDENICVKTLYPSKEQLVALGLKDGENEITFSVQTTLRGLQSVTCYAYLWEANSQLIVSDVDGTITKSDILGHLLPRVGKDWTHKGICSLYQRMTDNGYKLIYLSSRSISQINGTRDYLFSIQQDDKTLPRAPLLVAPDRIFAAFTREVVKRTPHEFKCRMLHTVKMAFPADTEPFYAGFGNRVNDAWAYSSVGIKPHKVFLIDPQSNIHVFDNRVKLKTYGGLDELCDNTFPPLKEKEKVVPTEYNSFNFWCLSPSMGVEGDMDPNDLDTNDVYVPQEISKAPSQSPGTAAPQSKPGLAAAWGSSPVPSGILEKALTSPPRSPIVEASTPPIKAEPVGSPSPPPSSWGLSSIFGRSKSPPPADEVEQSKQKEEPSKE